MLKIKWMLLYSLLTCYFRKLDGKRFAVTNQKMEWRLTIVLKVLKEKVQGHIDAHFLLCKNRPHDGQRLLAANDELKLYDF